MSRVIHSGVGIDEALTSDSKLMRTMARCTVSGWVELLSEWVNAEVTRPDGDPMVAVQAMSIVFIQTIGSVAAQVSRPSGDEILKSGLIAMINEQLLGHMARVRREALR